jgi:hypothetical protein
VPFLRRRRRTPPPDLVEGLGIGTGERLLAWAASDPAGAVVATDVALYLPTRAGTERIGWERVDRATWDRDEELLTVAEASAGGRPRRHALRVLDAAELTVVVRERVNATVVLSRHVPIEGTRGVTVVGRRPPGSDRLTWTVAVDRGLDLADPPTRARVDAALAEVRSEVGG